MSEEVFDDDNDVDDPFLKKASSTFQQYIKPPRLISIIGDEDTCVGFLIAGIGEEKEFDESNYFVTDRDTEEYKIEEAFRKFIKRPDIGLVLITKEAAEKIPFSLKNYRSIDPAVLIIPGHNGPFEIESPMAVQEIETRRLSMTLGSRRSSASSSTSIKTTASCSASRKSSSHSIRSVR